MKKIFTLSDKARLEYSASICRVGDILPIEGSDFIGKTVVFGENMIVRKSEYKSGDIVIYCPIETVINKKFLSSNNLFELSERHLNSNFEEIQKLLDNDKMEEAKSKVGFFNKFGRVKILKLRGVISLGFVFKPEELLKWKPNLDLSDIESYIGQQFDTIDDELFIKVYVPKLPPRAKEHKDRTKDGTKNERKRNRNLSKLNRMINGEFFFHYDTNKLNCNMWKINPTDKVTVSLKIHGTSIIMAHIPVKFPIKLKPVEHLIKKHVDRKIRNLQHSLTLSKSKKKSNEIYRNLTTLRKRIILNYIIKYDHVYSSRTVIKNKYINSKVRNGFYKKDVWYDYNELMSPYIDKDMTIYGEIAGYVTHSQTMIQKDYDYGCKTGDNFLMIYRITKKNENGERKEWNVTDIQKWTKKLIKDHPELKGKVRPIDILYHGTLTDLYPNISTEHNWHDDILEALKNDVEHFGMELDEPLCVKKVPREGIVIRIDDDKKAEAFKLKCARFFEKESKNTDKGQVDIEMEESYSDEE